MSRAFCIPGVFFLFAAFVLLFIVSVSLPYLTAMDVVRTHFADGVSTNSSSDALEQVRFGIWAYCGKTTSGGNTFCVRTGHGYSVPIQHQSNSITIGSNWTRGLAVHPVACGVTFIALLLSLSTHVTVTLIASLVSFLAGLLAFIAFLINSALYTWVKHEMKNLGAGDNTITGPGYWLTFVAFLLCFLAGCTVCFGRRRDRMSDASGYTTEKPGLFSRFRRNRNAV